MPEYTKLQHTMQVQAIKLKYIQHIQYRYIAITYNITHTHTVTTVQLQHTMTTIQLQHTPYILIKIVIKNQ